MAAQTPSYERPPVVETILGVQFSPLPKLTSAHLGAYWASLGDEWPTTEDVPSLEPVFETFDLANNWAKVGGRLRARQHFPIRTRFRNADGNRMIQVQNGRFIYNWLAPKKFPYPGYEAIREEFLTQFRQFVVFLTSTGMGLPKAEQWEITYLNHIPKGTVWNNPGDWSFFRPLNPDFNRLSAGTLESINGEWHYEIIPRKGRLHVTWSHSLREDNQQELIVLNLTARGPCAASLSDAEIAMNGLDLGHTTIVTSFAELMTDEANQYWGKQ